MSPKTLVWLPLVACACGRPATVEECELIVERIARLQISEARPDSAQEVIDREVEAEKKLLRPRIQERCVGKRITEQTMECVRAAKTSDDIIEKCFG